MQLNFTKMHSLGNDFVIIDLITQYFKLSSTHIKRIADRNFGVGCDQVILVEPPIKSDANFYYRIFNHDGNEAEQCANGARCAAKFVTDTGLTNTTKLTADCLAGSVTFDVSDNNLITTKFEQIAPIINHCCDLNLTNKLPNEIYTLSLGNPHGICMVDDLSSTPVNEWGPVLSSLSLFPHGANIGFMQLIDNSNILLEVYERGAGKTLACGSSACAAMLIGRNLNILQNKISVAFTHGKLTISYQENPCTLQVTGPAISVFTGNFRI